MRLEEIVNMNALKGHISGMGARHALTQARDAAFDLAVNETNKKEIQSMFNICNQLNDAELTDFRAMLAIEGIFAKLTEDNKHAFCSSMYPQLKKHTANDQATLVV
jgi:hypothetical protein